MKTELEIISTETIKPSSPTPTNLRHHKLCSLDQTPIPNVYIPLVFFYANHDSAPHSQILQQRISLLKKSLSETLTLFFPVAGTVSKDELSVDCHDRGASFTTAKVNSFSLTEFLTQTPDLKLITDLFLPFGGNITIDVPLQINIQATVFEKCGGIAMGSYISHAIMDGTSMSFFLRTFADISNGYWSSSSRTLEQVSLKVDFSSAFSLFPARDLRVKEASTLMWGSVYKKGRSVTRRFLFDGSSIDRLKRKANTSCTRVEAITAYAWMRSMAASTKSGGNLVKPSLLQPAVNLRKRAGPHLFQHSVGNLYWNASPRVKAENRKKMIESFSDVVNEVKRSFAEIDGEFVKRLMGEEGTARMIQLTNEITDEICSDDVDYFGSSSWCRFGFYELDFGWGKPVWVGTRDASCPFLANFVVLMDANCDNGIEVWLTLDEKSMAVLETDQEFLEFAALNPSPLKNN